MVVALLLALDISAAEPAALNAYLDCVLSEATRLQPSKENAEDIATAAVLNCEAKLPAAAKALDAASNESLRARGWPTVMTGRLHTSDELEPEVKAKAREAAVTIIVEARLKAPAR